MAGRRVIGARRRAASFTLVELIVGLAIFAAVLSVGGRAFLTILNGSGQLREEAAAFHGLRLVASELRRTAANLIPGGFGGAPSYEEAADPKSGKRLFRFVTRVPDGYAEPRGLGGAQAFREEYALALQDNGAVEVSFTRNPLGGEVAGETEVRQTLARNLAECEIAPILAGEEEGGGGEQSEPPTPVAFSLLLSSRTAEGREFALTTLLPVYGSDFTEKSPPEASSGGSAPRLRGGSGGPSSQPRGDSDGVSRPSR